MIDSPYLAVEILTLHCLRLTNKEESLQMWQEAPLSTTQDRLKGLWFPTAWATRLPLTFVIRTSKVEFEWRGNSWILEIGIVILSEKVLEIITRNMKIARRTAPERILRLLFYGTHYANFAMKPKTILPTAFPKMTSTALPNCVQQATRKANNNRRIQRQDENPYESSESRIQCVRSFGRLLFRIACSVCSTFDVWCFG